MLITRMRISAEAPVRYRFPSSPPALHASGEMVGQTPGRHLAAAGQCTVSLAVAASIYQRRRLMRYVTPHADANCGKRARGRGGSADKLRKSVKVQRMVSC